MVVAICGGQAHWLIERTAFCHYLPTSFTLLVLSGSLTLEETNTKDVDKQPPLPMNGLHSLVMPQLLTPFVLALRTWATGVRTVFGDASRLRSIVVTLMLLA